MKLTDTKNIMVYVETADKAPVNCALETLGKASEIASSRGEEVIAVLIGKDLEKAADLSIQAGADKVIIVDKDCNQVEAYRSILLEVIKKYKPSVVMAGATPLGKDLTPVLAMRFESGCAVDVIDIKITDDKFVMTCPVYGGTVLNDIVIKESPIVMTIRSGAFSKVIDSSRKGEIIKEDISVPESALLTKVLEAVKEIGEQVNLEEAEVIVSGGRGMGSKENFELVKKLADVCGGVVGATRPAIEDEWVPRSHQVGQSGKIVSPKLYIACGISGATQHLSGMVGSEYIVAINKDEDAPIFDVADVGIVGDAIKVVPLLIEEIKKIKAM
ncbi:electron transfer flavoprotein subunit alpha/FixB family protein [Fusobacterium sp.]|uniref:electron transfer flavoprotein subunit alpha/FixB family protein n=1 Tax=Fusobacterium sp. TaxID=68766 RepID=UPI0026135977|nr:electron transfer flavoprotein subunit alpha/FixB family protein [Fusobacterium sp.]